MLVSRLVGRQLRHLDDDALRGAVFDALFDQLVDLVSIKQSVQLAIKIRFLLPGDQFPKTARWQRFGGVFHSRFLSCFDDDFCLCSMRLNPALRRGKVTRRLSIDIASTRSTGVPFIFGDIPVGIDGVSGSRVLVDFADDLRPASCRAGVSF